MGKLKRGIAPTCGHEGLIRAKGLCNNCYQKQRYERLPPSECHPDRKEHCSKLCRECYRLGGRAKRSECHPERLQIAKGLCRECYGNLPDNKSRAVMVRRLRKYGLSQSQYDALLVRQNWACAICGGEPGAVDHDHKSGAVRGLLCRACNTGIGILRDDPERMEAAAKYIRLTTPKRR